MWIQFILIVVLTAILSFLIFQKIKNRKNKIPLEDLIQDNINQRIKNRYSIGIVVGIVEPEGNRFFVAGHQSKACQTPINEDHIFELGSMSKVFTALLLAQLSQKDKINLNDPIDKWLPQEFPLPHWKNKAILLKHLANHTSGLPHLPKNFELKSLKNPYASYSKEELYRFLSTYTLDRAPGKTYVYSAIGMSLLGHILSISCTQPFSQLLEEYISQPLNLKDTCLNLTKEQKKRIAQGHNSRLESVPNWTYQVLEGAGGIYSSARDLLTFLSAQMMLTKTPLSSAIKQTQQSKKVTGSHRMHPGLGWHKLKIMGQELFIHDGLSGGYQSFMGFNKKQKRGVIILANSSNPIDDLGLHILNEKFPLLPVKQEFKLSEKQLKKYMGQYQWKKAGDIEITKMKKYLRLKLPLQPTLTLYPESHLCFFTKEANLKIEFSQKKNGQISDLSFYKGSKKIKAKKLH